MTIREIVKEAKERGFTHFYYPGFVGVEKTLDLLLTFPLPQDGWEWAEMGGCYHGSWGW